jgi:hypothetical protein
MKSTLLFTGIVLAAIFFAGCQDGGTMAPPVTEDPNMTAIRMIEAEIQSAQCDTGGGRVNRNFIGVLSGSQEVPPTDSKGRGVAAFRISKDGDSISYRLIVANITNVVGAEVHLGVVGENGPAVLELNTDSLQVNPLLGPIGRGTFKPSDLIGPYAGSVDFDMFLADLHADSLYVNVRTSDGVDSTSGVTGDYNDGEIRGQLMTLPPWGDWWGHDGDKDHHDKGKHKGKGHDKGKGKGHDKGKGKGHDKDGDGKDDHRDGGHGNGGHGNGGRNGHGG